MRAFVGQAGTFAPLRRAQDDEWREGCSVSREGWQSNAAERARVVDSCNEGVAWAWRGTDAELMEWGLLCCMSMLCVAVDWDCLGWRRSLAADTHRLCLVMLLVAHVQDIRNFQALSVSDALTVAPPAANMATYDTSLANSNCADVSYM